MSAAATHSARRTAGGFLENIMYFARTLRAAGLPIGPGKVLAAVEAVRAVGLDNRDDFYWTLHAVFVNRRDQRELFDQAFHIFWRNPQAAREDDGLLLPEIARARAGEGRGDEPPPRRGAAWPGDGDGKDQARPRSSSTRR